MTPDGAKHQSVRPLSIKVKRLGGFDHNRRVLTASAT